MFVSLDGIDGGGKSTQLTMLADYLRQRGFEVAIFRDPGSSKLGEAVRDLLLHREEVPIGMTSEMLLYMAARAQLVHEMIRPALEKGKVVLCDRFLLANVVYQGCGGGLSLEALWQVGEIATDGLAPDLTVVLDLPVEVARARVGGSKDRLEKRSGEFFERVRTGFLEQVSRASKHFLVVDATHSIEDVHTQIVDRLGPLLHQ